METESQESPKLTRISPWKLGVESIKQLRAKLVYLSLVGMAIPLMGFEIYQSTVAQKYSHNFMLLYKDSKNWTLFDFLEPLASYISHYGLSWFAMSWVMLIGYFGVIALTSQHFLGKNLSTLEALGRGVKTLLPRGLIATTALALMLIMVSIFSVTILGPILHIVLLILFALCTAAPFLLVHKKVSAIKSISQSVSLSYVPKIPGLKWNVFFQLGSLQMFLVATIILCAAGKQYLLDMDQYTGIPRGVWIAPSPWQPLSWAYIAAHFVYSIITSLSISFFAVITTTFFMMLSNKFSIQRTV